MASRLIIAGTLDDSGRMQFGTVARARAFPGNLYDWLQWSDWFPEVSAGTASVASTLVDGSRLSEVPGAWHGPRPPHCPGGSGRAHLVTAPRICPFISEDRRVDFGI